MEPIPVTLKERSYNIHVGNGVLSEAGKLLRQLDLSRRVVVISSEEILSHHGSQLLNSLRRANLVSEVVTVVEGEPFKTLSSVEFVCKKLVQARADRKTVLVAFGGGVIGDIVGFVAASFLRGVPYAQVPTTLLAQIDSSIGGKTGVNLAEGKNLIGAFYQPKAVIVDPLVLETLPRREFHSGIYEALKYGIIRDARLFDLVDRRHELFPQRDKASLERMIRDCARIKAQIVSKDEREGGLRMILNFGHTIGHALEAATRYRTLTHGEAIGHGMIMATRLASKLGKINDGEASRIEGAIRRISSLPSIHTLPWKKVVNPMLADKKFVDQRLKFVLPLNVGKVEICEDTPKEAVEETIRCYLRSRAQKTPY
jgi:3-dehydroquinate synthase